MFWPFKRKADQPLTFDSWMVGAEKRGQSKQEAYAEWRKAYWLAYRGKPWSRRRAGVKGGRNRYRDMQTLTEEGAS